MLRTPGHWGDEGALRCFQRHEFPFHLRNCQAPMTVVSSQLRVHLALAISPHQTGPLSFQSNLILSPPTHTHAPSLQDKVQAPQPGMEKSSLQPYRPAVPATRAMPHAPNRQRYSLMSPPGLLSPHACSQLPTGATQSLQGPAPTMLFHATNMSAHFLRTRHQ